MSSLVDYKKIMLIQENITNFFPEKEEQNLKRLEERSITKNNDKTKFKNKVCLNDQTDSLFWCFYIILNGQHLYELNHSFQREKEFKIQSIEKLRNIKPQLKALKLKINETEDELLNSKNISIKGLIALSLLYKKNIFYVWDRKYYEFIINADEPINIIYKKNNTYSHYIDDKKYVFFTENYWSIQNIDKPIKSVTGYTRDELVDICKKLEIQMSSKETKKSLYEKILEKV